MKQKITFCRHGQTYENLLDKRLEKASGTKYEKIYLVDFFHKFGAKKDGSLDDNGKLYSLNRKSIHAAQELGQFLKRNYNEIPNEDLIIVTSGLSRAKHTAQIATTSMGLELTTSNYFHDSRLNESEVIEFRVMGKNLPIDLKERLEKSDLGVNNCAGLGNNEVEKFNELVIGGNDKEIQIYLQNIARNNQYVRDRILNSVANIKINTINEYANKFPNKHLIFIGHCHSTGALIKGLGQKLLSEHFVKNCWAYSFEKDENNHYKNINTFVPKN